MASEQQRRENITPEREVHIEKDLVPKITSHFESITVHVEDAGGTHDIAKHSHEIKENKESTIGDLNMDKSRETHEIGSHKLESLSEKMGEENAERHKDRQRESHADRARAANLVADKEAEGRRGRETGAHGVQKFEVRESEGDKEMRGSEGSQGMMMGMGGEKGSKGRQQEIEGRIMNVQGRDQSKTGAQGVQGESIEHMISKGGRQGEGREGMSSVGKGMESGVQRVGKFEVRGSEGEKQHGRQEMIVVGEREEVKGRRGEAEGRSMNIKDRESRTGAQGVGKVEVSRPEEEKGLKGPEDMAEGRERGTETMMKCKKEGRGGSEAGSKSSEEGRDLEYNGGAEMETSENKQQQQPSLEEISRFRQSAQQNSMETLQAAEERYLKAKESESQTASTTAQKAKETASQALGTAVEKGALVKNIVLEKGQQGLNVAKDTLASAGKTATEKEAQTKDVALEKGQQGLYAAKDTLANAGKTAMDYTVPVAQKTKDVAVSAGQTTLHYAGDVAVDLKDKATVVGWNAAHYTTEMAVEGTKTVARAVAGAAEYAGHKAVDIVSKPLSYTKDVALMTGEKAEEFTARKKEESQRDYEAKKSAQANQPKGTETTYQEGESREETWSRPVERGQETRGLESQFINREGAQESDAGMMGTVAQTLGVIPGAVGETLVDIAQATKENIIGMGQGTEESGGQDVWYDQQGKESAGANKESAGANKLKGTESAYQGGTESQFMQKQSGGGTERFSQEVSQLQREGAQGGGTGVMGTVGQTLGVMPGAVGETWVDIAQETKENIIGEDRDVDESDSQGKAGRVSATPEAVGETLVGIAQTTKENVKRVGSGSRGRAKENPN